MKPISFLSRSGLTPLLAPLGLAVGGLLLVAGARSLFADGGGTLPSGGGDAIGSLPMTFGGGPEGASSQRPPSIVLEGPSLAAIDLLVVDAYGQGGYAEVFAPDAMGRVRVELQGSITAVLDRNRLNTLGVTVGLDVSQGFSGGIGILSKGSRLTATQQLPMLGDLSIPLASLSSSGLLDSGALTLHSISLQQQHHILEMSGSGNAVRLVSRD